MRTLRNTAIALVLLTSAFPAVPLLADTSAELVVGLAPPRPGTAASAQRARFERRLSALGLTGGGTLADGLGLSAESARASASARAGAPGARPNPFDLDPWRVWRIAAADSAAAAAAVATLAADGDVEWVEPNQPREAVSLAAHAEVAAPGAEPGSMTAARAGTIPAALPSASARALPALSPLLEPGFPSDPHFRDTRQWFLWNAAPGSAYGGVPRADIHALEAWNIITGSNDLRLAIADTGVDPNHPEYQCVMPDGGTRIERGINVTADPSRTYADSAGHGVTVAGVFAARTNEGWHIADSLGVAGICGGNGRDNFGCRLVPIKITPGRSNLSSSFDIARAMIYAVEVGARAMNLSFAGDGPSRLERTALYYAITRGCVVSAAAGNQGFLYGTKPQYPAAYAAEGLCIQSGATDYFDRRAAFSSYGPGLDLVAPGVTIWSTYLTYTHPISGAPGKGYNRDSGTSYAAPMVTGAIGLLAALRPELEDTDFQHILRESADDIGAPGVDPQTGWGRLNLARALEAVGPAVGVWHDEVLGSVAGAGPTDTLIIHETGPGTFDRFRQWRDAVELEVLATVAIPDSFLDPVRVWPRVGGTMTVRGDFRIPYFTPWAEVAAQDARSFTLRGYIYRQSDATCRPCGDDAYLPLPPDQARIGFTVIGPVDRAPAVAIAAPRAEQTLTPGDTVAVAFEASDPDEVSATEVWLEREGSSPLLLARERSGAGADREPVVGRTARDRSAGAAREAIGARRGAGARPARPSGGARIAQIVVPCAGETGGRGVLRVRALDERGPWRDAGEAAVAVTIAPAPCVAGAAVVLPPRLRVSPNPFHAGVRITAPGAGRVEIVDATGRRVRAMALGEGAPAHEWDGRDERGRNLPPGLYFARFEGAAGRSVVKIMKLRQGAALP